MDAALGTFDPGGDAHHDRPDPRRRQRFDIAEEPAARHLLDELVDGDADAIEVVLDDISPGKKGNGHRSGRMQPPGDAPHRAAVFAHDAGCAADQLGYHQIGRHGTPPSHAAGEPAELPAVPPTHGSPDRGPARRVDPVALGEEGHE